MTDGCTLAPELNVHDCCVQHDYDYADQIGRWKADYKFLKCCLKRNILVGCVYFLFVRCLGWYAYNKYKEELL